MPALYKLLKGSVFFTTANSIEAVAPFLLAPILTRTLDQYSYGVWVLFLAYFSVTRPMANLTTQDAIRMRFFELTNKQLGEYFFSAFWLSTIMATLLLVLCLVFSEPIAAFIKFDETWLISIVVASYISGLFYTFLAINQFSELRRNYVKLHLVQSFTGLSLIVALVVWGFGWQGAVIGKTVGLAVAVIVGFFQLKKILLDNHVSLKASIQSDYFKELLQFGLCYLPAGICLVAIATTDRLIIANYLGVAESGLYGVAALFGVAFFILINGFIHAWMPWLFKKLRSDEKQDTKEVFYTSIVYMTLLPCFGVLIYFVSMFIGPIVIGEGFHEAFDYIAWVMIATTAQGYMHHNMALLHFKKKISYISVCNCVAIGLNIYLSLMWVEERGIDGVIHATAYSFGAAFLISGILACKILKSEAK